MKQFKKNLLMLSLLTLANGSYAIQCPTNFNNINIGDSIATVEAACGAPTTKTEKPAPDNDPQEWSYFLPSPGINNMMFKEQSSLKTTISLDAQGIVVNISTNGVGSETLSTCPGGSISVGATREEVQDACGKPVIISKSDSNKPAADSKSPENKMIEYYYAGPPAGTLIFIKGVLTEKR